MDPITPGIQTQPGIVAAVGPAKVISGPRVSGVNPGFGARLLPHQPIVPTFNSTGQLGSTGLIGGEITSGIAHGLIDADPITPGIQTRPGIVTPIGSTQVLTGPTLLPVRGSRLNTQMFGGAAIDADPITPGIQTQPGIVTAVGPSTISSTPLNINEALSIALPGVI